MSIQPQKAYQWIASLYFLQSLPYFVVVVIALLVYQQHGMDNRSSALITSLLVLPWAIKPLFAPFLEKIASKKKLTIFSQVFIAFIFLLLAISINKTNFLIISTLLFGGLAFSSALHDVVADGIYLLNLDEQNQKKYVPLRTIFYQFGRLFIKGGLLVLAGRLAMSYGINVWSLFFSALCLIVCLLALFHWIKIPERDITHQSKQNNYMAICKSLIFKRELYPALIFLFLYNFSDAQMQKIIPLFLLDKMGMDLSLSQFATVYGIGGSIALISGVFISGLLISRYKLNDCMKNITLLLLMGHLLFFFLSFDEHNIFFIYTVILVNQLLFGLVNGTYMGYLLSVANKGAYPMSMYTLCTAIMALSYVFFGAFSGLLEQFLGYSWFFFYIFLANIFLAMMTCWRMNQDG